MKKYFRSKYTGEIYAEYEIIHAAQIFRILENDTFKDFAEVKPSVIDFLKQNDTIKATMLYRDIHNSTLKEAKNMVNKIKEDYERFRTRESIKHYIKEHI